MTSACIGPSRASSPAYQRRSSSSASTAQGSPRHGPFVAEVRRPDGGARDWAASRILVHGAEARDSRGIEIYRLGSARRHEGSGVAPVGKLALRRKPAELMAVRASLGGAPEAKTPRNPLWVASRTSDPGNLGTSSDGRWWARRRHPDALCVALSARSGAATRARFAVPLGKVRGTFIDGRVASAASATLTRRTTSGGGRSRATRRHGREGRGFRTKRRGVQCPSRARLPFILDSPTSRSDGVILYEIRGRVEAL